MKEYEKEFIEKYPLSIAAWRETVKDDEYLITGDEEVMYEFQAGQYANWLHEKLSKKITWYKPSEKMPEVGDEIITLTIVISFTGLGRTYMEAELFNKFSLLTCNYWTYAKNFNFPKG
jgi:hypothetical protein